jgi:hypothetical protein
MAQHFDRVAKCPTLVRAHMADVQRRFDAYDAIAQKAIDNHRDRAHKDRMTLRGKYANPIVNLMDEIDSLRKMMVRIIQVQHQQINKYWKSIRDGRKTVKRGAPASLESVTMETMIQMSLRVIQDMKDMIPTLIQPLVAQVRVKLCALHDRMALFKQYTESDYCAFVRNANMASATTATLEHLNPNICPQCQHGQCYNCHP